jgi:transmembrane sensor
MGMDEKSWELLSAYFSGNINEADRRILEAWITASDENTRIFNEAQKIWASTGLRLKYKDLDSNQMLLELKVRIHSGQTPSGKVIAFLKQYGLHLRVAAGICLLTVSYFVIRNAAQTDKPIPPPLISIQTTTEVATFYLPDSSKVWLNVNSRLTYPEAFERSSIQLQGEAFFSVREDSSDFTVLTDHTQTKVIGTAFNINERADSTVIVSVASGTVIFSDRDPAQNRTMMVRAREKAVYERQKEIKKSPNNDPDFAAWRERNNPIFEREKTSPQDYLRTDYRWRKNAINQTVIEGTIRNNASLAAYYKIVLEVTYRKANGNQVTVELTVSDTVLPKEKIPYRKRLFDILSDTQTVVVRVKSAEVTSKNSY